MYGTCVGLVCPVGLTPESAAAAMRARIAAFGELPYVDTVGEPIIGSAVADVPPEIRGRQRIIELLVRAFEGIRQRLPEGVELARLPVLLCTRPAQRPGAPISRVMTEVEQRLGFSFKRAGSRHVAGGSITAFEAMALARRIFAEERIDACLVAAVDTLTDARTLKWLSGTGRLKTAQQSDGVIPGEASAVVLLTTHPITPSRVMVRGLGFSHETATVLNDEPLLGKGMAAAVRSALSEANMPMHEIALRLADVAGESYAFEELVLSQSRLMRQTRDAQPLWHPASSIGDTGAATGLIQLAWVEQASTRGYCPGRFALAQCSEAEGARAAAVLEI